MLLNKINIPEYSVSEFNKSFKQVIEENFNYVRIKGEISEIKKGSKGQIYFILKDNVSILSSVIWQDKRKNLKFDLELGIEVIATGKITTWSKYKTTYQLDVENIEIAGEGALLKLIEDRKKRLKERGLFKEEYKKKLPYLPSKIGIITSPTGSVIHDIIKRLRDRFPTDIDIWPVSVQGAESVNSIISALKGFNNELFINRPDVIIIARGGGSTEDLMPFNDESLAIEVFNSKIPIITAIGHETDTPIIDFVSDLRAPTPTAAAEVVIPSKKELGIIISNYAHRLENSVKDYIITKKEKISYLSRLLKSPSYILQSFNDKLEFNYHKIEKEIINIVNKKKFILNNLTRTINSPDKIIQFKKSFLLRLDNDLNKKTQNMIKTKLKTFNDLTRILNSNSINNNLRKGYVILSKSKKILKKSNELKQKDTVSIKFIDKNISSKIEKIN